MNEKIKELAVKTIGDYSKNQNWPFFTEELEDFAKLIMDECASACSSSKCGREVSAEDLIKMHFGV